MPSNSAAQTLDIFLPTADVTDQFARLCALHLGMGDTVLLSGPVGAGKSHFARALIRHHFGPHEDVPSPSFTLVQCYTNSDIEIWHADLYRLRSSADVTELGLYDAMGSALCLIEWPDRLGAEVPQTAIAVALSVQGDGRRALISGASAPLRAALSCAFCP